MHLLFTPNHVQLLNSCYPPTSALLTAGPEYSPNSHELSRLTYYASNHPGKLAKIGGELEKRLKHECRKARSGNLRSRASLLITLAIYRSLATECRRDIVLLSPFLMASVEMTLDATPTDLEVVARAASVFTAWTTFTDGHLIGADSQMTKSYLSSLKNFASLSCCEFQDLETKNRTRLIGFAALTGALISEALYNDSLQFRAQVSIILQPILVVLFQTEITLLEDQCSMVKDTPVSPYLTEFRTRPAIERRAASVHVHVDGDKGPSTADVSDASLRALFSLLSHANGVQLGNIMQALFDNLDQLKGWTSPAHCCWFSQKAADWAQYQYRYVVPTWLVERLLENQETTSVSALHIALTAMVTNVFSSPTTLVNLSSSDILSNLVTMLLRRVAIDHEDPLLPAVVESISSLGHHVYYSDQIQDLSSEMINRIVVIEVQGVFGRSNPLSRSSGIRCLLAGLVGLIQTAEKNDIIREKEVDLNKPRTPSMDMASGILDSTTHRTRVPPEIWQDTLSLLCDQEFPVRADYTAVLIFYLSQEMPKHGDVADTDGVKRVRKLAEGPFLQATHLNILLQAGDPANKFLNAIHGYLYILATSNSLGLASTPSRSASSTPHDNCPSTINHSNPPENLTADAVNEISSSTQANARRSFNSPHAPGVQKVALVEQFLERAPSQLVGLACATISDYSNILAILQTVYEGLPVRGLLTGVPMLLAMQAVSNTYDSEVSPQRIFAIRDVVAQAWSVIGKVWNCAELLQVVEQSIQSRGVSILSLTRHDGIAEWHPSRHPVLFPASASGQNLQWAGVNANEALTAICSSRVVQEATGVDRDTLHRRLSNPWTAQLALRDFDRSLPNNPTRGDSISPLLKISPALMHIENISLQSLTRSTRGLGVMDLREALEGRSNMSNTALGKAPSISTLDHASSFTGGDLRLTQTRSRPRGKKRTIPSGSGDVRDVLSKLGIGKQNGNLLKSSFPATNNLKGSSP